MFVFVSLLPPRSPPYFFGILCLCPSRNNVPEEGGVTLGLTVQSIGGVVRQVADTPKPSAKPWPQPPPTEVPPDTSGKRPVAGRPKPLLERSGNEVVANGAQDVVVRQEPDHLGPMFTVSFVFSL